MGSRFATLVNLSLSHTNADGPRTLAGVDDRAMEMLRSFSWPHNYTQFLRVINELTLAAKGPIVSQEEVYGVLGKERYVGVFATQVENTSAPLNLNRTMAEIEADIIRRVVDEKEGNQSAAAKQLGISRTTLWRTLQKEQSQAEGKI